MKPWRKAILLAWAPELTTFLTADAYVGAEHSIWRLLASNITWSR